MAKRIATAIVLLVISLAAIFVASPEPAVALLVVISLIGAVEIASLTGAKPVSGIISCLLAWAILLVAAKGSSYVVHTASTLCLIGALCFFIWKPNSIIAGPGSVFMIVGGGACALILKIQDIGTGSIVPNLLLLAIAPLWVGDSLAYFIGKSWGKHKLAPTVSPNKTVEGAVANLLGCLIAALSIGVSLGLPVVASIVAGVSTGILGQAGDLLQSRFKRRADAKDSGNLLPGHGGVLDRLDSFLFSVCPTMLILLLVSPELFHVKQWPLWGL